MNEEGWVNLVQGLLEKTRDGKIPWVQGNVKYEKFQHMRLNTKVDLEKTYDNFILTIFKLEKGAWVPVDRIVPESPEYYYLPEMDEYLYFVTPRLYSAIINYLSPDREKVAARLLEGIE